MTVIRLGLGHLIQRKNRMLPGHGAVHIFPMDGVSKAFVEAHSNQFAALLEHVRENFVNELLDDRLVRNMRHFLTNDLQKLIYLDELPETQFEVVCMKPSESPYSEQETIIQTEEGALYWEPLY